jgi:hypothetical protein
MSSGVGLGGSTGTDTQTMMDFWTKTLGLSNESFDYGKAKELNSLAQSAQLALDKARADWEMKIEIKRWLLAFAVAFFLQRNGMKVLQFVAGGMMGLVGSFMGLVVKS